MGILCKKQKDNKKMLSHEEIYKIMQWLPVLVSSVFFLINLIKGNTAAMIVIGICLATLVAISIITKKKSVSLYKKEFIMSVSLPILVFIISLFSGASYSDDFPLFIAVIAMTGLYLEPQFTKMQIVLVDIFLVIMYLVHPQKSGGLSQYILCAVCFTLATILIYQVIKRGRAFIEISQESAEQSGRLLESIRSMGNELQFDFDSSSEKIKLETQELQNASSMIALGAGEVSENCNMVQDKVKETEGQILSLNEGVRQFENALVENSNNVGAMNEQVHSASNIIGESTDEFKTIETQMKNIAGIAKQISDISFKLTILSLNASVESAHAGASGAGFEVIANEMRELSETSTGFSEQVSEVVSELLERVAKTSAKLAGSEVALTQSEEKMHELVSSFAKLIEQFTFLYDNIENQNNNINQIDCIFEELNRKVSDMYSSSQVNQNAVDSIADAMTTFSENIEKIVKNTQSI